MSNTNKFQKYVIPENCRIEVALYRLRTEHTKITREYLLKKVNLPLCQKYTLTLTVHHILIYC